MVLNIWCVQQMVTNGFKMVVNIFVFLLNPQFGELIQFDFFLQMGWNQQLEIVANNDEV